MVVYERKKYMIRAVFLDIDNTLLDFDAYVKDSMKVGFEKYGLKKYEDWMFPVFQEINHVMWCQLEQGELSYQELLKIRWNKVFEGLGISFDGEIFEKFFKGYLFESAIPVEGAMELLEYLKGKYVICAASNGPHGQQVNRLTKGGMISYFDHLFISERIGAAKPSKLFFDGAIRELNQKRLEKEKLERALEKKDFVQGEREILPEEILMIGDSLSSDMAGGVDSGLKTCLFDWKCGGNTKGLPIDYVVHTLKEIQEIL